MLSFDQAFAASSKGKGQFGASSAKPKGKAHAHVDQSNLKRRRLTRRRDAIIVERLVT